MIITTVAVVCSMLYGYVSAKCINPVTNCNASMNYFPTAAKFLHSQTVTQVQFSNTWIKIDLSYGDPLVTQSYTLVQCGCPAPTDKNDSVIFHVPVESVMVQDRVTVPKVSLLGQTYSIKYVEDASPISSTTFRSAVRYGIATDIKFDYSKISNDSLPDIIFTRPGLVLGDNGTQNPTWYNQSYTSSLEAKRFMETDLYEKTPLGRAELIKLYGIIFGVSETAESIFLAIDENYLAAKTAAHSYTATRSSLVRGFPKDGDWETVSKNSYLGYLLQDAGASFLDSEMFTTSSLPAQAFKDFFGQANTWIDIYGDNDGSSFGSEFDLFNGNQSKTYGADAQYFSDFVAVQCNRIFSNGAQKNGNGNPLYESGVLRPDLVLWDIVQITHPESFPMPNLHYYEFGGTSDSEKYAQNCPIANIPSSPSNGNVFVDRRFVISGVYPALYHNVIPSIVKPKIQALTGASVDKLSIFIMNSERYSDMTFDVQIRIYSEIGNITKFAYALEDAGTIISILSDSYITYLNSNSIRSSISFMKQVPASLTVGAVDDVTITNADGAKSTWTSGTTFSTGAMVGIVIGAIVFALIISYLASRIGFRKGKEYAYQKLEEEKGGMENVKSIDTLVAEFENADEEGDFVEMRPRTSNISINE